MESCVPLPLESDVLERVADNARDWALLHGAVMRFKGDYRKDSVSVAPFTLLPSVYSKQSFHQVISIQDQVNRITHLTAHNHSFLQSTLAKTVEADDFTAKLYEIYDTVRKEGFSQCKTLGILRSDYLPHTDRELRQVEMNSIACSFASFSNCISSLHGYTLSQLGHKDKIKNLPENNALRGVSDGLLHGWQAFGDSDSVILFLVEEVTLNIADQRFVEYQLSPHVTVMRKTLTYIGRHATLDNRKRLIVDGSVVGLVYMRVGYDPSHYSSRVEWDARLLIERSSAIKCPDIRLQLTGTKKMQQKLAEPGVVEQFTDDARVRQTFTAIYSLDSTEGGDVACQLGMSDPEKYVLKPQREGGGNNVYGEEVRSRLESMEPKERRGWILMERIFPPDQTNVIIRGQSNIFGRVVSELGVFGYIIGDSEKIYTSEQAGHMLRTKPSDVDEGGVAAGFAALDSPYLVT